MTNVSTLSFFADFKCQSCTRCCQGSWDVLINETDFRALEMIVKHLHGRKKVPQYLERIETHRDPKVYGKILKKADTRCVFLDKKDNLCTVQKEFGHEALPVSCKTFPRSRMRIADVDHYTLSTTCPTARGLIASATEVRVVQKKMDLDRHYPGIVSESVPGELSLKNRKITTAAYLHLKTFLVEQANNSKVTSLEEFLLNTMSILEHIDTLPTGAVLDVPTLENILKNEFEPASTTLAARLHSTPTDFERQRRLILTWLELRKSVGPLEPSEMIAVYDLAKDFLTVPENTSRFIETYHDSVSPFLKTQLTIVKNYLAAKIWFDPMVVNLDLFTFLSVPCFIAACLMRYLLTQKYLTDGKLTKEDLLHVIDVIDENSIHVGALLKGLPEGFKQRPIALSEIIGYIKI